MKTLTFFIIALFLGVTVSAQAPQSFRYQAVVRDNSGNVLANQTVSFRIRILSGSVSGTAVYSETHTGLSTNAFGLVEMEIGKGTPVSGTFSAINWGSNIYYVKIEMDPAGGSVYQVLSTSQLLSVPYALYAKNAENFNELDGDPQNEIQELSISENVISLSKGGGSVEIPSSVIPFASASGITRNINLNDHFVFGSTALDDISGTEDNRRIFFNKSKGAFRAGEAYSTDWDDANTGLYSVALGYKTKATGQASTAMGSSNAASGWYCTSMGYGTFATAINSVAMGKYNVGQGNPNAWIPEDPIFEIGIGTANVSRANAVTVLKNGNVGIGLANPDAKLDIDGKIKIRGGAPGAGKVLTSDASGSAAWETPTSELTLPFSKIVSANDAAFRIQNDGYGNAITAISNSPSSAVPYYGLLAITTSTNGLGVFGSATSSTGTNCGIFGNSQSSSGLGVYGNASSTTGTTYGVKGNVVSNNGYSGYFSGGKFYVSGNAGIGTENPGAKLEVTGQVKITGGSPGAGKVLTSDANGLASWQTAIGLTLPFDGDCSSADAAFSINQSGTGQGIYVYNPAETGEVTSISAHNNSSSGTGITAGMHASSGTATGILGFTVGTNGTGVKGISNATTGVNFGVVGESKSVDGIGVLGVSSSSTGTGTAVGGIATSPTSYSGFFNGGRFYIQGSTGIGVVNPTAKLDVDGQIKIRGGSPGAGKVLTSDANGLASWENSSGLILPYSSVISSTDPLFQIENTNGGGIFSISNTSVAILGRAVDLTASNVGVQGESRSINGIGVAGYSGISSGITRGVYGQSASITGVGIQGYAKHTTGTTKGVYGIVDSPSGFSGYFEGGKFYIDGNTGIGTENPSAKLEVSGQIKITGGNPGTGKVLTSDANGLASWQVQASGIFTSSGGITSNSIITDHFVIGSLSMDDVSGTADDIRLFFNKTKGAFRAGRTSSGEWNDALVGQYSAAFGDNNKASGSGSFASGVASVATGSVATAMGYFVNATAMLSTAVGSYNVGAGTKDSWVTSDPIFEIGNGTSDAARSNAVTVLKNGNTGIGTSAPSQKLHVKGSAAGNAVLYIEPNKWNAIGDYGELRLGDANHYIRGEYAKGMTFNDVDKFTFAGGNVGIGTDNPAAKLDISAAAGPNLIIRDSNGSNDRPGIQFVNNNIHFISGDDGSEEIFGFYSGYGNNRTYAARLNIHGPATGNWGKYIGFTHDGNHGRINTDAGYLVLEPAGQRVGIGTDTPTQSLDVNGNVRIRGIGSGAYAGTVNRMSDGTLTTASSDARLKENVETLYGCLNKVLQLRGVSFTWKSNPEYGLRYGFVAQEFEKVIPELVFTNETDGYKGINYAEVSAVLVEAVKELKAENDILKSKNENLESENKRINDRLEKIEMLMGLSADK